MDIKIHAMPDLPSITVLKDELHPPGKRVAAFIHDFVSRLRKNITAAYVKYADKAAAYEAELAQLEIELNLKGDHSKPVEDEVGKHYNWSTHILSDEWSPARAEKAIARMAHAKICDVLLDQAVFAGVNNIIKNEVLYRIRVHPECSIGSLPASKIKELVKEARNYSIDFYAWKKRFDLRKRWLIYKKKNCPLCHNAVIRNYAGATARLSCFCPSCQEQYPARPVAEKTTSLDKLIF